MACSDLLDFFSKLCNFLHYAAIKTFPKCDILKASNCYLTNKCKNCVPVKVHGKRLSDLLVFRLILLIAAVFKPFKQLRQAH